MSYRLPERLAWVDDAPGGEDANVYLAHVPDGQPLVLRGSARSIWLVAQESRDAQELAAVLADAVGLPASRIAPEVSAFLDELVTDGLLEEVP